MNRANDKGQRLISDAQLLAAKTPLLSDVMRGTLRRRYVRCGKAGCHCQKGRGHGPIIYLSVTLKGGKTQQITIAKEDYDTALRYVQNYQRLWRLLEKISTINRQLLSERLIAPDRKSAKRPRRRR